MTDTATTAVSRATFRNMLGLSSSKIDDVRWRARGFPPGGLDRLAAIIAGLTSLAYGLASIFEGGRVVHTVVVMDRGLMIVRAISHGASLVALAPADCDIGHVAYEMALLGEQTGHALSPAARSGQPETGPA